LNEKSGGYSIYKCVNGDECTKIDGLAHKIDVCPDGTGLKLSAKYKVKKYEGNRQNGDVIIKKKGIDVSCGLDGSLWFVSDE
jgi:hypothetical protein